MKRIINKIISSLLVIVFACAAPALQAGYASSVRPQRNQVEAQPGWMTRQWRAAKRKAAGLSTGAKAAIGVGVGIGAVATAIAIHHLMKGDTSDVDKGKETEDELTEEEAARRIQRMVRSKQLRKQVAERVKPGEFAKAAGELWKAEREAERLAAEKRIADAKAQFDLTEEEIATAKARAARVALTEEEREEFARKELEELYARQLEKTELERMRAQQELRLEGQIGRRKRILDPEAAEKKEFTIEEEKARIASEKEADEVAAELARVSQEKAELASWFATEARKMVMEMHYASFDDTESFVSDWASLFKKKSIEEMKEDLIKENVGTLRELKVDANKAYDEFEASQEEEIDDDGGISSNYSTVAEDDDDDGSGEEEEEDAGGEEEEEEE